jgi:ribonucleoside-triphosphate reductase
MEVTTELQGRFNQRPSTRQLTDVIKRDGTREAFDADRIRSAIARAGEATGEFDEMEAGILCSLVIKVLSYRHVEGPPHIEAIQDVVEQVLISSNHLRTARAYIAYREQHARLRDQERVLVDVGRTIDEYLKREDWRVSANANQGYSLGGLILNISGKMVANYWLSHVYPPEVGEAHRSGDFHVHDLDMLSGYCAGWSLRTLLNEGFNGVPAKVESSPPRHLSSAVGQMVNFLGTLQNEWAGAQAFSSFDTYLAPFVRKDRLSYQQVKQNIQEFVYSPRDLREQAPVIGGEEMPFTYGELQEEMNLINRAYIEVMGTGDARGRVFTFPIPTYNITPDFDWEHENTDALFEMTAKYGLGYFQNFINSDLAPHMVRSMCCRLQLDLRELLKRGNGLFGSAEQTGSIGVVTLNCARLGYNHSGDRQALTERLNYLLTLAKSALEIKRKVIQRQIDAGLLPYTKRYLGTLRNHFSTIGVNGLDECVRNFTWGQYGIDHPEGKELAAWILDEVRQRLLDFQNETGHMYNLEASPAEGATHRFAREDQRRYADIIQSGTAEAPYYTNSSQLPVAATDDPFQALTHQEDLQRKYTGGTVFHLYVGERVPSAAACKQLVRRVLQRFKIPYLTITPTFSICPEHGYLSGEQQSCPQCGARCEVWTRVMGYHRPVTEFNPGKQSEYQERKYFHLGRGAPA